MWQEAHVVPGQEASPQAVHIEVCLHRRPRPTIRTTWLAGTTYTATGVSPFHMEEEDRLDSTENGYHREQREHEVSHQNYESDSVKHQVTPRKNGQATEKKVKRGAKVLIMLKATYARLGAWLSKVTKAAPNQIRS